MKSIRNLLGQNVRIFRKGKGMTQGELAEKCGLSLSFLQGIESGKKWASAESIECLADYFGIAASELFRDRAAETRHDARTALRFLADALGVEFDSEVNSEVRQ